MKKRVGQRLKVTIDRISGSGNGVVDQEDGGHINLGPIYKKFVGEEIMIRMIGPHSAEPLDSECRKDVYAQQNNKGEKDIQIGDIISGRIKKRNADGIPIIETGGVKARVPGAELNEFVEIEIESFVESDSRWQIVAGKQITTQKIAPENQEENTQNENKITPTNKEEQVDLQGSDSRINRSKPTKPTTSTINSQTGTVEESTKSPDSDDNSIFDVHSENLSELRSRAENQASADPARSNVNSSPSKYVRSASIKKYAKARSGGNCEWCEDTAPFQSKTGEPYLEVHHVDELGNGGEDRLDRVVALCPTCHSKIHYGVTGSDLNDQVKKKLETKIEPINQ